MADERGSITSVSDNAGAMLAINRYDEYGIPASTNLGRFGYSRGSRWPGGPGRHETQTWLPEIGMWHYRARIYSPTLGRFLQTDPIGYGDGMNLYAYVGGDPVNFVDPLGLCQEDERDREGNCPPDIIVNGVREFPYAVCGVVGREDCSAFLRNALSDIDVCALGATNFDLLQVALVPEGNTIGGGPRNRGGRYLTDLNGGYPEALALFVALSRRNQQPEVRPGNITEMTDGRGFAVLVSRNAQTGEEGAVRLRYGPQTLSLTARWIWKLDVAAGSNPDLPTMAETVHFTSDSRHRSPICPRN